MKNLSPLLLVLCLTLTAQAGDWNAAPSYFTHNPETGERTHQYAAAPAVYSTTSPSFVRSGYRHFRSSIQVGNSADHFHRVEEFGAPVRPYGEWRFPYRPYSVPYGAWGPQPVVGFGGYGYGGGAPGAGIPPQAFQPYGAGAFNSRSGIQPPQFDGSYPQQRIPPPLP